MPKAEIKLPSGTTVSVSGTPEEITAVVRKLEGGSEAEKGETTAQSRRDKQAKRRFPKTEITDLIENLIDGGFFKKPKDLAAIKLALAEMGYHYPVTTLSPTMLRQVRKRHLRRLKQDNRWMYTG